MKKFFKVFFISLGSLLGLALLLAGIALWLIFTPSRLTPIVERHIQEFVNCRAEIGSVELTLFRTFPRFGIRIDGLTLLNHVDGAASDTLLNVRQFSGAVDIKALLGRDELILRDLSLTDGRINAYVNADGKANFDIVPADDSPADSVSSGGFGRIDADDLRVANIDISYADDASGMKASVKGLSGKVKGSIVGDLANAGTDLRLVSAEFEYTGGNSNKDNTAIRADVSKISLRASAVVDGDILSADITMPPGAVSLSLDGKSYLRENLVSVCMSAKIDMERKSAAIDGFTLSIDELKLDANGTVANNADDDSIAADLSYKFGNLSIKELLAMVPHSLSSHFEGADADGLLSSEGTVKGMYRMENPTYGEYRKASMPLIDAHLTVENAYVKCDKILPFPLAGVNGDLNIHTDLVDDKISYIRINNLSAGTPRSSLAAAGFVDRLFSDMRIDLAVNTDMTLEEFAPILPKSTGIEMKGRMAGNIRGIATMSQILKMELDKAKFSGRLNMYDIYVACNDSLSVRSNATIVDFSLPDSRTSRENTGFAAVKITVDSLDAQMKGVVSASALGTVVELETSDIGDTTRFPAIMCRYGFDALSGHTDSAGLSAAKSSGSVSLSTSRRAERPKFNMTFNGGELDCRTNDERIFVEKVYIKAGVAYDESQHDFFLKWRPRGSLEIENGSAESGIFTHPVHIPSVKMDFSPRELNIDRMGVIMGGTDFNLSGKLSDILPYFKGDSILKGDFHFSSSMADVGMLMNLTSGLGGDMGKAGNETGAEGEAGAGAVWMADVNIGIGDNARVGDGTGIGDNGAGVRGGAVDRAGTKGETDIKTSAGGIDGLPADTVRNSPHYMSQDTNYITRDTKRKQLQSADTVRNSSPYMVPQRMDLVLHAGIERALWQNDTIRDVRGDVIVKNGALVLDSVTFTSPATKMALTAIYRTERLNHLFVGLDLHMLDVEIAELLRMVPDLGTLMPMLASLDGRGEFHVAAETYLDSTYTMKLSTLLGAASIRGNDLVLMDGQTFGEIAKKLRFNKKTENKIDSLAAECSIFRNQIDVYPFLLVMDKYKVVVGGRHDTNMSFDYNISLVESPLPIRLSVNINGTFDDLHFKLIKNPYKSFYRPVSRRIVEGQQLKLRNIIRNSLLRKEEELEN